MVFFRIMDLVEKHGLDAKKTRLLRHDTRAVKCYASSLNDFMYYSSFQVDGAKSPYNNAKFALHFLPERLEGHGDLAARFVCATSIGESWIYGDANRKPRWRSNMRAYEVLSTDRVYELEILPEFEPYRDCLVIDWGNHGLTWSRWLEAHNRAIIEYSPFAKDKPFPGYFNFRENLAALPSLPKSWKEKLSSVNGVYLLVCQVTGKQYVGSANGEQGFWQRWQDYIFDENATVGMRQHPYHDFEVMILEIASRNLTSSQIVNLENAWKRRLKSVEFGLNLS